MQKLRDEREDRQKRVVCNETSPHCSRAEREMRAASFVMTAICYPSYLGVIVKFTYMDGFIIKRNLVCDEFTMLIA